MPRRPKPPDDSTTTRVVRIHTIYYALLWEICSRLGFKTESSTLSKCLEYIIKDLYDTIASEEEEVKEVKKSKEIEKEYYISIRRPPPPP
jgi:hypothetical protein